MAAPHAFLDILAQPQVRDAFLAGRITLILSADLETILWANGSGARFLGFRTVAEALNEAGGFAALTRRAVEAALSSGKAVSVPGVEGSRDFLAARLDGPLMPGAVFLRSAAPAGGSGPLLLTEGLNDETSEAALVDDQGRLMSAGAGFDPALLADPGLAPLLADAARDGGVKKRFLGGASPYPVGVLRLNAEPPVLLLIAAKTAAETAGADNGPGGAFAVDESRLPARFVFRTDSEGRFIEVSPELAETAGPLYGNIAGRRFAHLAKAWQMDKSGTVRALLQSGNPWSGQKLAWPAEGTEKRAQIALAALPVYAADRRFMGFRGFGVIEKMVDNMSDDERPEGEAGKSDLSHEERQAFAAIGRRLGAGADEERQQAERDAAYVWGNDNDDAAADYDAAAIPPDDDYAGAPAGGAAGRDYDHAARAEGAARALAAKAEEQAAGSEPPRHEDLPPQHEARPPHSEPQAAEEDIFAELASSVKAAMEAELRGHAAPSAAPRGQPQQIKPPHEISPAAAEPPAGIASAEALQQARASAAAHMLAQNQRIAALEQQVAELNYRNGRLNFLLNALSEAVLLLDKDGTVISANEAAARLFGRAVNDLAGRRAAELFDSPAAAALNADFTAARAENAGAFLHAGREAQARKANGAELRLRLNFGCLEPGRSYFLLLRDMTRFHDIIASLLQRNAGEAELYQRRARYLALVSHEIRTPLSALLGMAQFMADEKAGPIDNATYKDYLADIGRAGSHILALLNDILRPASGPGEPGGPDSWLKMAIAPMPLFGALNEVLALMTPRANAANIIMRSGAARDLPAVMANARAVKQILLNLISNAIRFTSAGGQIIISAYELPEHALGRSGGEARGSAAGGRCVLVRISDTGIGMSEEAIARTMRDPLAEDAAPPAGAGENAGEAAKAAEAPAGTAAADAAAPGNAGAKEAEFDGAGLGLPVVRALAEANGIRFSLSSEPGRGTTASLVFQVAETEPQA